MRRVATAAAFGFHRHMLVKERTLLIGMALVTDSIAARQSAQLRYGRGSVGIMAVDALHQSFIHAVVVGFGEIRFGGCVAPIAKLRLALHQQMLFFHRVVRRVAVQTTHIAVGVGRLCEVRMLLTFAVAAQAAGAVFLPRMLAENVNLAFITTTGNVLRPRPVAAFTALLRGTSPRVQSRLPMGRLCPGVVDFLVTGFAGIRPYILRSIRR